MVKTSDEDKSLVPVERITQAIVLIRGQKVMLDEDLAQLYEVETKALNRAVSGMSAAFRKTSCFN